MKYLPKDVFLMTALSVATLGMLAGCQRQAPADEAVAPSPAPAVTAEQPSAAAYQPPTADQLYALVSPIALFPDKLVALTLAASTHPDDVHAARGFLEDRRNLSGSALIDAAADEPWDPSVKALVAFPAVVDQLDGHDDWTAALGAAYAAEPTDVLNAIQVMRQRARAHGSLRDTPQQTVRVTDTPETTTVVDERRVVDPPAQTIEIEPAQPDVVYVPSYDPDVVYGEPVYSRVYTTERWYEPAPDRGDLVATGLLSFGAGVLVGELFAHDGHHDHPWGWDAWRTSWGGPRGGGYGRPAVVYDNHPYVVNRTTVINRYTHIDRSVHIDNRHDFGNVSVHNTFDRGGPAPGPGRFVPPAAAPRTVDFAHMQRPSFSPAMMHATAPNSRPALPAPGAERAAFAAHAGNEPPRPPEAHAPAAGGAMEPGRPHAFDPATAQRHDRPSPAPAAAPRQETHDDVRMPPRDTRLAQHTPPPADPGLTHGAEPRMEPRAEPRVEPHMEPQAQPHMEQRMEPRAQPRMEQHVEPRMESHAQPHVEARPEQHQASRPAPHHDEHRPPAHEDKHDH